MANLHLDANQPAANTEAAHIQDVLSKSGADEAYKALIGDSLTQTKGMNHRDADQYRTTLGNDLEAKGILPQLSAAYLYENRGHLQTGEERPGYGEHASISEASVQSSVAYLHSMDQTKMQFDHTSLNERLLETAAADFKGVTGADSGIYVVSLGAELKNDSVTAATAVKSANEEHERSAHLKQNRKDFKSLLDNGGRLFDALADASRTQDGDPPAITAAGLARFEEFYATPEQKKVTEELRAQLNNKHGYVDQGGIATWSIVIHKVK